MTLPKIIQNLGAVLALSLAAFSVSAASITYHFAGTLDDSFDTLHAGDAFSGDYTIDPTISALGGSTSSQSVFNNLIGASLTIGSFSASIGPGAGLPEIQQDDNVSGQDRYALVGRNPVGSLMVGGLDISAIGILLTDSTQTAISDALALLTHPTLASFTGRSLLIFFGDPTSTDPDGFKVVNGTLSTLTTVPEPASLALLGLGACAAGLRRSPLSLSKKR
jgi:hypothetical protein